MLVKEGHVTGWDDPRMPTLSGMRRRGFPAEAIRRVCTQTGITKVEGTTDIALLEHAVREVLNRDAARRMAVLDPLKLVIENLPADHHEEVEVPNNPEQEEAGTRTVPLGRELWIERADFMEDPPRKFFRLGPGRSVRLRGAYIITCTGFEKNARGELTAVRCECLPGTIGAPPPEGVKCRTAIHWVSAAQAVRAEVRLYDRMFKTENPNLSEGAFLGELNPDSLVVSEAWVEPSLAAEQPGFSCQFERIGYFCADEKDHVPGERAVFNRTIALRDSWGKGR
jgi:glutaminyl-tRNA synthetase